MRGQFLQGLKLLDEQSVRREKAPFLKLSAVKQAALLEAFEAEGKGEAYEFFQLAKNTTARVYFETEVGFKELNKNGVPKTWACTHPGRHDKCNIPTRSITFTRLATRSRAQNSVSTTLLKRYMLGNPQDSLRVVHVAGTNGKGSTCAMIEAAARSAGLRTGLYTSPHLVEPTERIVIDGTPCLGSSSSALLPACMKRACVWRPIPPTSRPSLRWPFCCFWMPMWISRCGSRPRGTSGRHNVVTPTVCAITPVDFDHEAFLGSSLEQIAGEKAGILKPEVPAVIAPQRPEAEEAISAALEVGAPVDFLRVEEFCNVHITLLRLRFDFRGSM